MEIKFLHLAALSPSGMYPQASARWVKAGPLPAALALRVTSDCSRLSPRSPGSVVSLRRCLLRLAALSPPAPSVPSVADLVPCVFSCSQGGRIVAQSSPLGLAEELCFLTGCDPGPPVLSSAPRSLSLVLVWEPYTSDPGISRTSPSAPSPFCLLLLLQRDTVLSVLMGSQDGIGPTRTAHFPGSRIWTAIFGD